MTEYFCGNKSYICLLFNSMVIIGNNRVCAARNEGKYEEKKQNPTYQLTLTDIGIRFCYKRELKSKPLSLAAG